MMQRRLLWILLGAALLAVTVVALTIPGNTQRGPERSGSLLFENLSERINEVDRLDVRGAGNELLVSLIKGEEAWTVDGWSSYPADWAKVREVLTGVAWASVVELKTANPDYFSRLGVEDPRAADAQGVLLEIGIGPDKTALILGNEAGSQSGQYVRIDGEDQTYLVADPLDVPRSATGWVDDLVLDLGSGQVAEVSIGHVDGEQLTVSRVSADDGDFDLQAVPAGRETLAAWAINRLGGVFSDLRMEAVLPESRFSGTPLATVRVLTFSGLEVTGEVSEHEDKAWIKVFAQQHQAGQPTSGEELAVEPEQDSNAEAIQEIHSRTSGWVYQIPDAKREAMLKHTADLLKPIENEQGQEE